LSIRSFPANYIRAMPTIDLTDEEHAAVTAAIRRAIETDRFPRAPRLDPLRSALTKLEPTNAPKARRQPKPTSGRGDSLPPTAASEPDDPHRDHPSRV
jgi:hypothetical protein